MKKKILENCFSIVSLFLAVLAILISLRANQIAEDNSAGRASVVKDFGAESTAIAQCPKEEVYLLGFYVVDHFTVSNLGGRKLALVDINLEINGIEAYKTQSSVRIYHPEDEYVHFSIPNEGNKVMLPQNIEAGSSFRWLAEGILYVSYSYETKAIDEVRKLIDTRHDLIWEFKFNDGTVITHEYPTTYGFSAAVPDDVTEKLCNPSK